MAKTNTSHGTTRSAAQDLQKEACKLVSSITGTHWGSSRDDTCEIKPRTSGQAGVDVVISLRVRELLNKIGFPTAIECKNTKQWDLQRAIIQARANAGNTDWILVMKRRAKLKKDRIDPVVVMDMGVFEALILACLNAEG